jgi:acetyl esterase
MGSRTASAPCVGLMTTPGCDEGSMYAQRLAEAGVEVEVHQYDGMLHGFLGCAGVVDAAWQALDVAGVAVRRALLR